MGLRRKLYYGMTSFYHVHMYVGHTNILGITSTTIDKLLSRVQDVLDYIDVK